MAEEKKSGPATRRFKALTTIHHDQEVYKPGETIELTAKQAKQLLEHKAVEAIGKQADDAPEKGTETQS